MRASASSYASRIHRFRLPRLCVPVVGADASIMIERAESLVRDNPFIELRLDYLSTAAGRFPKLKTFLEMHPEATVIATCRRAVNGGKFKGSVAAELAILLKAADVGVPLGGHRVTKRQESLKPDQLRGLHRPGRIDHLLPRLQATRKLDEQFAEMSQYPADFYKVVSTATNLSDNVVMMKFLEANSGRHEMVGLCMGEQGIISRVLGVRAGSIFTFGAAKRGEETAPGQVLSMNYATSTASTWIDQQPKSMAWRGIQSNIRSRHDDECRVSPRIRECGLSGAARQEPERPAGLCPRHTDSRPQHHHAV